jgi:hypothetical protein
VEQVNTLSNGEMTMFTKALIGLSAVIAFSAAAATPVLSANTKYRQARPAASHYLPAPAYGFRQYRRAHSPHPAHDVYVNGRYAGSDPDSFIRSQLAHDPPWNYGR